MSSTRTCQYCGKKFSKKMRICPFCGGEHKREVTMKTPYCPDCKRILTTRGYRGTVIYVCPGCKGVWVDTKDFKRLSSERDTYKDESISYTYLKKPLRKKKGYRSCVRCGSFMLRKNFKKISGVIIDICADHGVWLDNGELEQIRCFIANGGLEKYQEYLDQRISFNHEEIRKFASDLSNVRFIQQMLHLYKLKYWILKLLRR